MKLKLLLNVRPDRWGVEVDVGRFGVWVASAPEERKHFATLTIGRRSWSATAKEVAA